MVCLEMPSRSLWRAGKSRATISSQGIGGSPLGRLTGRPTPYAVPSVRAMKTLHHRAYEAAGLAASKERTVSVCLPARDEAATIGAILERLMPLREAGAIDQVVVVDDSA